MAVQYLSLNQGPYFRKEVLSQPFPYRQFRYPVEEQVRHDGVRNLQ